MQFRTLCKWITITGILIIWIVKWGIRPSFHFNLPVTFFLGVAPNLLGSFLLPFGAYWLLQKYMELGGTLLLRWFCTGSFVLLMINEYLQKIPVFGRTFDYYDILASAAGLYGAYWGLVKYYLSKNYLKELN